MHWHTSEGVRHWAFPIAWCSRSLVNRDIFRWAHLIGIWQSSTVRSGCEPRHQTLRKQSTRRAQRRRPVHRAGRSRSGPRAQGPVLQLARSESTHAQFWRDKLTAAGIDQPAHVPDFRTRLLARLARHFGPRFVLPSIAAAEYADRNKYAEQADAQSLSAEERGHAAIVHAVAQPGAQSAGVTGAEIARAEPWHRGGSGTTCARRCWEQMTAWSPISA